MSIFFTEPPHSSTPPPNSPTKAKATETPPKRTPAAAHPRISLPPKLSGANLIESPSSSGLAPNLPAETDTEMTTINTATPSKAMLPFRSISSYAARFGRAVVASAPKTNRSLLPVTFPRAPTPTPPNPGLSNNQNSPILLEDILVLIANNPKLPDSVVTYFTNSDQFLDKLVELKESVKTGATFTSSKESLEASKASLVKAEDIIVLLYPIQLNMQQNEQSYGDTLDVKLHNIGKCKDMYHTIFTSSTIVSGVGAFAGAKVHPVSLAMAVGGFAAAASMVFLAVGKRMDSHQDERKIPVKKCKDISEAITGATKLTIRYLDEIMASAGDLKSHTQSILAMVGPQTAAESNAIVNKLAALKLGFQILEAKVDRCIMDANSARQGVFHTVMNNLD